MAGKGSKRRPMEIGRKTFDENWDRIFKKQTEEDITMNVSFDDYDLETTVTNTGEIEVFVEEIDYAINDDICHTNFTVSDIANIGDIEIDTTFDLDLED
jgi:hypothetical protein